MKAEGMVSPYDHLLLSTCYQGFILIVESQYLLHARLHRPCQGNVTATFVLPDVAAAATGASTSVCFRHVVAAKYFGPLSVCHFNKRGASWNMKL